MFKPRNSDLQKSLSKLSDSKKDQKTRFKHLKIILDHKDPVESKKVLSEDPEEVFRVFGDCFHALDQSFKLKGQRVSKEDVENVLFSLERILVLLPEYIRKHREQLGVISIVLKRCLHPSNTLRLRRDAMRPFLIFYQILRDLCGEDLHQLFLVLVPGLMDHGTNGSPDSANTETIFLHSPPLLLPPVTEKSPEHISRFMYETLMDLLVSQVFRIQWDQTDQYQMSFAFLFEKFKMGYLSRIFPHARASWSPVAGTSNPSTNSGTRYFPADTVIFSLQVATLKWLVTFLQSPENLKSENVVEAPKKRSRDTSLSSSDNPDAPQAQPHSGKPTKDATSTTGFTATVQNLLHFDVNVSSSVLEGKLKQNYSTNIFLLVRHTLLSSPHNVQLVHELFETAFKFPLSEFSVIRRVVSVYFNWIAAAEGHKTGTTNGADCVDTGFRATASNQHFGSGQNALKLFCANSIPPFATDLVASDTSMSARNLLLDEQEDICKRIIALYRFAILKVPMSLSTWECVLSTLIRITHTLMPVEPPKDRLSALCGRLAMPLFQTLLVAWVKGTLCAYISHKLWDELTNILSTLTAWDELIVRWEKTLELITRMFAEAVFGISAESASEYGQSLSPLNNSSDDGTLTADQPRSRSSASIENDQFTGFLLGSSGRSETSGTSGIDGDGSITEVPELEETEGGKSDTLKAGEDPNSLARYSLKSEDNAEEIQINFSESQMDASRSSSTPDSLRESLNSPLFYPISEAERKRAPSASSLISVMAGGPIQGWSPDSACALWFRVFGVIGPVNNIRQASSHKFALQSVQRIVNILHNIQQKKDSEANLSKGTALPVAEKFAPIAIIAPLLLETMDLDGRFQSSQVLALEMLLQMTFHAEKIPRMFLVQLYRVLHKALLSDCPEVIEVVLVGIGMRLFCSDLPNAVLLLDDVVTVTQSLIHSPQPALQLTCVRLLASVLFFLKRLPAEFPVFAPIRDTFVVQKCDRSQLEGKIHDVVLQFTNLTLDSSVRISAFYCVGATLHQLLESGTGQLRTVEQFLDKVLRAIENYAGEGALEVANILIILIDHAQKLTKLNCSLVVNIIEVLCNVLQRMTMEISSSLELSKDLEKMFIKLVFGLCEWISAVPAVISMNPLNGPEKATVLSLMEKTLEGLLSLSDPLVKAEQDDLHHLRVEEFKGKGKRALSDHLVFDRRFSADIGSTFSGKNLTDEEPILSRRTTIFGRPTPEPAKEKERKQTTPHFDFRSQPVFSEGRFRTLKLTGSYAARHIVNIFQAVPDSETWTLPSSLVTEEESVPPDGLLLDHIQTFALYDLIITFIKTDGVDIVGSQKDQNSILSSFPEYPSVRIIIRDIAGKYCYDMTTLFGAKNTIENVHSPGVTLVDGKPSSVNLDRLKRQSSTGMEHSYQNIDDLKLNHSDDVVLDILRYVDTTSPDLGVFRGRDWRDPGPAPTGLTATEESAGVALMQEQFALMEECVQEKMEKNSYWASTSAPQSFSIPDAVFGYCSRLLSQFGYASLAKRQYFHLLNKTEDMFRDLKLLDKRPNRETHKIAVIYVGRGQEDKMSIMTNSVGSEAYERFVGRLGWKVDMTKHKGFRGGLPANSRQFGNAVYYASATVEMIFHVATRVTALTSEEHTAKMRHIGNDEVQIVWSDHYEDYDRKNLPTQFGDVIICVYPTEPKGLYRIQILRRGHVPQFGPLFDGAVVDEDNLAGLVRNTALFAGRACREQIRGFQHFFEERADYLRSLIQGHSLEGSTTYESFFANIISPQPPKFIIPSVQMRDLSACLRPTWRESQKRYKERAKSVALQQPTVTLRNRDTAALGTRFSFPLQLGTDSSATDV